MTLEIEIETEGTRAEYEGEEKVVEIETEGTLAEYTGEEEVVLDAISNPKISDRLRYNQEWRRYKNIMTRRVWCSLDDADSMIVALESAHDHARALHDIGLVSSKLVNDIRRTYIKLSNQVLQAKLPPLR